MDIAAILSIVALLLLAVSALYARALNQVKQQAAILAGLRKQDAECCRFIENTASKIIRYDQDCRRIYISQSLDPSLNQYTASLLGKTPEEYPGGESGELCTRSIRGVFNTKVNTSFDMDWHDQAGEHHVIRFDLLPELDNHGNVVSVLGVGQDITGVVAYRAEIARVTSFDQLTSLPNRIFIYERMQQLIRMQQLASDPQEMPYFSLIYLDLDAFRELNDLLGYVLADELLCQVALRLQAIMPAAPFSDIATLARLGGDEFAILLPANSITPRLSANKTNAASSLKRRKRHLNQFAQKIIHTLTPPFKIGDKDVYVSACMGIVMCPEHSENPDQLLLFADVAKGQAKKLGRNNFQFYQAGFTKQSVARAELDAALRTAIQNEEFHLYYQPQVMLETRYIIGAEALLRWKHPTLGIISPGRFIARAEETGLIIDIGNWVLRTAFQAAVAWNGSKIWSAEAETSAQPLKISINISPRQFVRNDLVGTIRQLLEETGCMPQWIELEMTESLLLDETGDILPKLIELNNLGVALSIDDFGTGYSALSYLTRFPISQIKIDRSFICDIPNHRENCELVKVLIQIANVLNLDLVAEGIETAEQLEYLARCGCKVVQGSFYHWPMPYEKFNLLVQKNKPVSRKNTLPSVSTLSALI